MSLGLFPRGNRRTTGGGGGGATITQIDQAIAAGDVNVPAHNAGDFGVGFVLEWGAGGTPPTITDWEYLGLQISHTNDRLWAFKRASLPGGSITFGTGVNDVSAVFVYRGSGGTVDVGDFDGHSLSGTPIVIPALTLNGDNSHVCALASSHTGETTLTWETLTQRGSVDGSGTRRAANADSNGAISSFSSEDVTTAGGISMALAVEVKIT